MARDVATSMAIIVLGSLLQGVYTVPMKHVNWPWECTWFVFAATGLFILPWVLAFATCPNLVDVYSSASSSSVFAATGFGFLWGCGGVCFGLATDEIGISLAFSIILGMTSTLGSVLPLVTEHSDEIGTTTGICNWVGLFLVICGVILVGRAGSLREMEQAGARSIGPDALRGSLEALLEEEKSFVGRSSDKGVQSEVSPSSTGKSFKRGLVLSLMSGVLSSCLNFAFTFADHIKDRAQDHGAHSYFASNAVWALALSAGFIAQGGYPAMLLTRNGTWLCYFTGAPPGSTRRGGSVSDSDSPKRGLAKPLLHDEETAMGRENVTPAGAGAGGVVSSSSAPATTGHDLLVWEDEDEVTNSGVCAGTREPFRSLVLCAAMGFMWLAGTALYGSGADVMGDLGSVLGWPVFMDGTIITGNLAGLASGEWQGSKLPSQRFMGAGTLCLLGAIIVIGVGGSS